MRESDDPRRGPLVFLGTAVFAVPALATLAAAGESLALVVTQPDRPKGRGRKLEPSPVKREAERLGLPVFQPGRLSEPGAVARLAALQPEFLVVVAYGQLLRPEVLALPRRGAVNLHPSLLPRHRGPSPVAWTLLHGDAEGGNTTMFLDEGMDSGPLLLQEVEAVSPDVTRGELEASLALSGADLLVRTLAGVRRGEITPRPQDPAAMTLSQLITRDLRPVPWDLPAPQVRGRVHALAPSPGAVCRCDGKLLKVLRVAEAPGAGAPATVLGHDPGGPRVACGAGALVLAQVQPEGRRAMTGAEFVRGGGAPVGSRLEAPWDG
ncbi:MAG: methionyl-tRNA formyltransferase [Deferrisomatales bacterium]|nr:methionyl-tRNA formyltransferase [Deferrisomatales bacterium]